MTDFNKRVEFQLSCQWTDVTTLLIVWFVISIVLKEKKVKKNNRVDTIIQDIRVDGFQQFALIPPYTFLIFLHDHV